MEPSALIAQHLARQEGGTFHARTGEIPRRGFAYNPTGTALLRVAGPDSRDQGVLSQFVAEALALVRTEYLGTWRHPDGNLVFLETVVTNDAAAAHRAVVATGQLAYYDLSAGREVRV